MTKDFEKNGQVLLAHIGDGGYNIGTNFPWKKVSDLKGHKILGAGLNLNWMKEANIGIVPVTDGLPGWYEKIKTGVAEGGIMFPSAWGPVFKLHEVGKYYTIHRLRLDHLARLDRQHPLLEQPAAGSAADHPGSRARATSSRPASSTRSVTRRTWIGCAAHITVSDLPDCRSS